MPRGDLLRRAGVYLCACVLALVPGGPGTAAESDEAEAGSGSEERPDSGEAADTGYQEVVVVTAARAEQKIKDVPASVTVLPAGTIERAPADDLGDLLRTVPGVNVAQNSVLDFSISSRRATATLPQGQLALIDHRPIYQDFIGQVLWGHVPIDLGEIERIEVVRGPASAVWGANAMDGVIHLITKPPRDTVGTALALEGGTLGSESASVAHSGVHGSLAYRVTGGYSAQDPYDSPTGTIPGTDGPTNPGGTQYPVFDTNRVRSPRFDFRVDADRGAEGIWSFSGGSSGLDGTVLTPGGPLEFLERSSDSFVKTDWSRGGMRASVYSNLLHGSSMVLLSGGTYDFDTETTAADFTDTRLAGGRHLLTYGASVRYSDYRLDVAPDAEARDQYGAFLQDELRIDERFSLVLGTRWDHIDPMGNAISPRVGVLYSPHPRHTIHASYNRAFRSPTTIENYVDIGTGSLLSLPGGPFFAPAPTVGNPDLGEERLDAYEIGWFGTFGGRASASIAVYRDDTEDFIRIVPTSHYTSQNPPPGWPLPPDVLDLPPPAGFGGALPSGFGYVNIGEVVDTGIEASLDLALAKGWSVFANYSLQRRPEVHGIPPVTHPSGAVVDQVNLPPRHRVNAGVAWNGRRVFANAGLNYASEAFWTDVLDSRYWGPTQGYTQVNGAVGVRLAQDTLVLALRAQNLLDADVQQHLFGDFISRKITGQLIARF